MVQAAFGFAVMSLFVKAASRTLPTMEIVFARGVVTLGLGAWQLHRAKLSPFGSRPGLLLFRGLVGSLALVCFYAAVAHLPLGEATVIHQTAPLFTACFAAWLLREPLERRVLLAIGVCLCGVVLIARPAALGSAAAAAALDWRYAFVALLGAVLSAIAYVAVRRLGRSEPAVLVVFYFPLVTVPLAAPFAMAQWVWPDALGWLCLVGVGCATQFAQLAMTKGLALLPAGRATAIGYLQVVFALLFGVLVFGDRPDGWSWLGIAVVAAGLWGGSRGFQPRN